MQPAKQIKTPERIEFEDALKEAQAHINELDLKARMSEDGINPAKVTRQTFDAIKRINDIQAKIRQKYQKTTQEIQEEATTRINEAQQQMQAELAAGTEELKRIQGDIKAAQGITGSAIIYPEGAE